MSISRKNLSRLYTQLGRGALTKPMISRSRPFFYRCRIYPHTSPLATSATALHSLVNTRRLSSDSSSSSISPRASIQRASQTDKVGWKALSTQIDDIVGNLVWLAPRKGTGKDRKKLEKKTSFETSTFLIATCFNFFLCLRQPIIWIVTVFVC